MARDAYAAHDLGDGTHTHPALDQRTIDIAKVTRHERSRTSGRLVLISYDTVLPCCGRKVSTLTVGEVLPNA